MIVSAAVGCKPMLGGAHGHALIAESSSRQLIRNETCAPIDEQLTYARRQRGRDVLTQAPQPLSPHLQKAARNKQDEEVGRARSSKASDTARDQDVRSKSARSREVRAASDRGAREKGTPQPCRQGRALGGIPGVGVERHVDRQGQRDFRAFAQ